MSILMIGEKSKMFQATPGNRNYLNPYRSNFQKQQIRTYKQSKQEEYRNQLLNQIKQKQYKKQTQKKRLIQLELKHQKQFYQKLKLQASRLNQKNNQNFNGERLPKINKNRQDYSHEFRQQSPNYHRLAHYNNKSPLNFQLKFQSPSLQRDYYSKQRNKTESSTYDYNDYNQYNSMNPQQENYSSVYHYQNLIDPILLNNDYAQRKKQLKESLDRKSHQIYDLLMYSKNLIKKDFRSESIRITKRLKTQNFYRDLSLIEQNQKLVRKKGSNGASEPLHLRNLSNFQNYELELINNSSGQGKISQFYKLPKLSQKRYQTYIEEKQLLQANQNDYQDQQ